MKQKQRGLKVLSLFDGLSGGQIALKKLGIKVSHYYASEIDKYAIQVAQNNFPNTIQVGDVQKLKAKQFPEIDLFIGGSPCQNFSFAGKQEGMAGKKGKKTVEILTLKKYLKLKKQGFEFEGESFLFWEYVRLWKKIKPKYFLLENVMMSEKWQTIITKALGVEPIEINSALLSGQNRRRLYWTNIPNIVQPKDKGIMLKDVLLTDGEPVCCSSSGRGGGVVEARMSSNKKAHTMTKAGYSSRSFSGVIEKLVHTDKALDYMDKKTKGGRTHWEFYLHNESDFEKSRALTANLRKGVPYNVLVDKRLILKNTFGIKTRKGYVVRKFHPIECERLQTVPMVGKQIRIESCLDQAKNFVDAVNRNHKLQKLVSSVEGKRLQEYVKFAFTATQQNQVKTKSTVQQNVDMLTQKEIKKCTKYNQQGQNINAKFAKRNKTFKNQKNVVASVHSNVFINIIEGKIVNFGKVEFQQNDKSLLSLLNGKIALSSFGSVIKECVEGAEQVLEKLKINNSTFITSSHLSINNIEQLIVICYYFAENVISGFIPKKTQKNSLLLNLFDGYTASVSDSQRYKMLGNGWTIDVIAHIFKNLPFYERKSKKKLVKRC